MSKQTKESCRTRKISSLIQCIIIGNKRTEAASSFLFGGKLYYMQFLITCRTFILHPKAKSLLMIREIVFFCCLFFVFFSCINKLIGLFFFFFYFLFLFVVNSVIH